MNLSDIIYSFGTPSIINFTRKHNEKLRQSDREEVASLADRNQVAIDELELAYAAQAVEREKRQDLARALRKSLAMLRAEFMDEKSVNRVSNLCA